MNKNINIPSDRKFSIHYVGKTNGIFDNDEYDVSGDVLNTEVYGLYEKDLINVSNLDVDKQVSVTSYNNKLLVTRTA
tara:strand:- start:1257 stop:1487 length:231 start_codon:yes stop_codon:yes gene_type:complete